MSKKNPKVESADVDPVNPPHYQYGKDNVYEVIKVCEAWELDTDAYLFNVIKYVSRAGKKDPNKKREDLNKALYYLLRRINVMDKEESEKKQKS
jgi:hypothetical protein